MSFYSHNRFGHIFVYALLGACVGYLVSGGLVACYHVDYADIYLQHATWALQSDNQMCLRFMVICGAVGAMLGAVRHLMKSVG